MRATPNAAYWICAQAGVNPLAIGMPGIAKTQTVYAFAKATGRKVYTLIASLRDPADIGGYPYPDGNGEGAVMRLIPPSWAADCSNGNKWIVFLDELTTCAPACQAAMLRILAEKHVGDTPLSPDTWLLGACNPPEQAANGIELEAAMANRLYHHEWEVDHNAVLDGYCNGLEFPEPEFPRLPDTWQDHLGLTGKLVAEFHRKNPGRLCKFPTDRAQASGPWPSPRTWEYAIRCLAAAQSVGAEKTVELALLTGLVGEAVALEFNTWRDNLDLPDPEDLIAEAIAASLAGREMRYEHPDRADKVLAMMAAVNWAVMGNNNARRWEAGMSIMEHAARYDMDVALAGARPLSRAIKDANGAKLSAEFVSRLYPRIQKALED